MADNLIDKLKELGFNTYEAKVYLALLKQHPATGYEISKESGVPQARAYDTLKALEANNVVVAMGGKPVTYTPISPEELLDRWERSFKGNIGFLRKALPSLSNETVEPVINLRGDDAVFQHAEELISRAKRTIFAQMWHQDAVRLGDALREAQARGVQLKIVGYDNCTISGVNVFQHGYAKTIEQTHGLRWLFVSADDDEGLVGTLPLDNERPSQAVITKNAGIVLLIKEFVGHDIFVLDIEANLRTEIVSLYGEDLAKLRHKIMGEVPVPGLRMH